MMKTNLSQTFHMRKCWECCTKLRTIENLGYSTVIQSGTHKTRRRNLCKKRSIQRLREMVRSGSVPQPNMSPDTDITLPGAPDLETVETKYTIPECTCKCIRLQVNRNVYGGQNSLVNSVHIHCSFN